MKVLTADQEMALRVLGESELKDRFYWSGGTALAFCYLKHRGSVDVDFFSGERFVFDDLMGFVEMFKKKSGLTKMTYEKIYDRWELLFENERRSLRVEFVYYNHGRKTLGKKTEHLGVMVDSLFDLAANKTMVLMDRNEPKDVVDIYYLVKKTRFAPKKLLRMVEKKFGASVSEGLFWSEATKKLSRLNEIEWLLAGGRKTVDVVREFFEEGSRQFLKRKLG